MSQKDGRGWIGVDLDGTLAHYDGWKGADYIGDPIPRMVHKVRRALQEGREVKIFTARVGIGRGFSDISQAADTIEFADRQRKMIEDWTEEIIGTRLEVTAQKDWGMVELWDDRAVQIVPNTGRSLEEMWVEMFRDLFGLIGDREDN